MREIIGTETRLCAVVKANAYGLGAPRCARAALAGGADWLAVAAASEAAELRRHDIDAPLLILGALTHEDARVALQAEADIVAWDADFAQWLARTARGLGVVGRVHVLFDSGMGHLGSKDPMEATVVAKVVDEADHLHLAGVMTHFATADARSDSYFGGQLATFMAFVERFRERRPDVRVHAANSAATFRDKAAHFDMVRCGAALLGLDPFHDDPGLGPLRTAHAPLLCGRSPSLQVCDSVHYGRVGTIPIGYGDGWRREFTNNADVLIIGRRYPLVGRVSMDNMTVDLGPDTDIRAGAVVTLIGRDGDERITIEDLAKRIGTINYDITCGLSQRFRREWGEDGWSTGPNGLSTHFGPWGRETVEDARG